MGRLVLDSLEEGMVLAADVNDRAGRLLLGAGVELTRKHLLIFRTWGIEDADIAGVGDSETIAPLPSEVTQEQLDAAEASLAPLFEMSNIDHPAMRELMRLAALKKVRYAAD